MKTILKPLALAAAVALAAPATAQETVRWGIPMAFGSNLTALGDTMPWVSEQLKKISGGSVNLQVFEPGKLVPALGIFDAVSRQGRGRLQLHGL
jgi:TRAP-type mannitol/chloroaromatic compound transport system substrate-binding protein